MRYAARVDDNQESIVAGLRRLGAWVWSTAPLGNGFPDLLVWWRGRYVLFEVKNPALSPSARRLTEKETAFFILCPGERHVIETLDEAVAILTDPPCPSCGRKKEKAA